MPVTGAPRISLDGAQGPGVQHLYGHWPVADIIEQARAQLRLGDARIVQDFNQIISIRFNSIQFAFL